MSNGSKANFQDYEKDKCPVGRTSIIRTGEYKS